MKIQKNMGTVDRVLRIVAGAVLLLLVPLVLAGPEYGCAFFGLLGVFPLVAGMVGYCPPYAFLGINTSKENAGRGDKVDDEFPEPKCC